jgi:hypothetical protein
LQEFLQRVDRLIVLDEKHQNILPFLDLNKDKQSSGVQRGKAMTAGSSNNPKVEISQ